MTRVQPEARIINVDNARNANILVRVSSYDIYCGVSDL